MTYPLKPKPYQKTISTVISIKIPQHEIQMVEQYLLIKELNFAEFILPVVNGFINLEDLEIMRDSLLIASLLRKPSFQNAFDLPQLEEFDFDSPPSPPKIKISIRVNKKILQQWNLYCEKHFLTRTGLIRASLFQFFYHQPTEIVPSKI